MRFTLRRTQERVIRGNNVCRCQGSDRPSTLLSPPTMTLLLGDILRSPYLRQLRFSLFSGSEHIQVPKYLCDAHRTCNVEPSLSASWAIRAANWATAGPSHPSILLFDSYRDIRPASFGQSEKDFCLVILPPIVLCHAEEGFSVPLCSVPDTEVVPCRRLRHRWRTTIGIDRPDECSTSSPGGATIPDLCLS